MPTGQPHSSLPAKQGQFPKFMIADDEPRAVAEFSAELAETFLRALE
jgi:hypothetical protein